MNRKTLILVLFFFTIIVRLIPGPRTIDDAYITFRYVNNILAGKGFVYNSGEFVLGTTTPLYTFLLSGFGYLFRGTHFSLPEIAWIINGLSDGITAILLLLIGEQCGYLLAGIGAGFVWAIAPYSVTFAIGGLETSFYILLLVSTIWFYLEQEGKFKRNSLRISAFLASLVLLTRPDGILLIVPLFIHRLFHYKHSRRDFFAESFLFLLPLLSWALFGWSYFGSPIPHSIYAKSQAYVLPATAGAVRLIQHYATPFLGHLTFGLPWIGVGLILYPFLFYIGARQSFQRHPALLPALVFPWIYLLTFGVANPLIFRWYLSTPLPFYFLFILIGMQKLVTDLSIAVSRKINFAKLEISKKSPQLLTILFVIIIPFGLSLQDWQIHPEHGPDRPAPEMAWIQLELLYKQAAKYLLEDVRLAPSAVVAAGDVGVLGYELPNRILDTVGLNSLVSAKYYPIENKYYTINYAIPPDLIIDQEPDYVVILEVYGREGLLKDPRFLKEYNQVYKITTDIYGSDGLLMYSRQ